MMTEHVSTSRSSPAAGSSSRARTRSSTRAAAARRSARPIRTSTSTIWCWATPRALRDLQDTPIARDHRFPGRARQAAAASTTTPTCRRASSWRCEAGGLTEPILRGVYDGLPQMFDRRAMLTRLVEQDRRHRLSRRLGAAAARRRGNVRVRAVGTRQLHITAGNVPVVARAHDRSARRADQVGHA